MYTGLTYPLGQLLTWTRRDIVRHAAIATLSTAAYAWLGWRWLAVPWLPIALLGTAVAFVVGFKNNASYDRLWEARRVWGAIVNASRTWGLMARPAKLKALKGKEFDKFYIENEVGYHKTVTDAVDAVLIPGAQNGELKSALQGAQPLFLKHLEHARMIQSGGGHQ